MSSNRESRAVAGIWEAAQRGVSRSLIVSLLLLFSSAAIAQQSAIPAPRFDINRFDVTGNTLLPAEEVERLVTPFTGKQKDFADIQRALEALELAYRERGFGIVQVQLPEQDITKGVVQFRVVQPRMRNVVVEGNKHYTSENIRRSVPTVREGETPNSKAIARNLQMTAENPVKETSVLLRSADRDDQVDATIKVQDDKPWRMFVSIDNTGTSDTGYWRAGIGYQHANLFDRDHTLTAQYITSPTDASKVSIYGLGYRIPYYELNSSLDLIAGYSDVDSGAVQGLFNVSGQGSIYAARWNYYLPRWQDVEHKVSVGLDYRAYQNQVTFSGTGLVPDITVHPLGVTYSGTHRAAAAETHFYITGAANIPGGNDGSDADFQRSRAGATANYTVLRLGGSHTMAFKNDVQLRLALNGQYTDDALVAGEQFGIGGPDSVRGYLLRETANDKGYSANFELYTPDFSGKLPKVEGLGGLKVRALAFFDYGSVSRNKALPGESEGETLKSVGVGVRVGITRKFNLRLDVANLLKDGPTRQTGQTHASVALAILF